MRNFALALALGIAQHAAASPGISPAMEKALAARIEVVKGWAAEPVLVKAVLAQNEEGPIPGMDNAKWKTRDARDEAIQRHMVSAAGRFLARKIRDSGGTLLRAFLNGARGEKVAFSEKTISYLHQGQPKFDVPFKTGRVWHGEPDVDAITGARHIQVGVPVVSGGKTIGVLVVGIDVAKLES
ncbi:MAG: hypothetical protein ABIT01_17495 [Thermoanaerobaculia bacterium]